VIFVCKRNESLWGWPARKSNSESEREDWMGPDAPRSSFLCL
jgi:hypothetical protein